MEEDILNYLYQLSCFVGHPVCSELGLGNVPNLETTENLQ